MAQACASPFDRAAAFGFLFKFYTAATPPPRNFEAYRAHDFTLAQDAFSISLREYDAASPAATTPKAAYHDMRKHAS